MNAIEDFLSLPYHIVLIADGDDDGRSGWVAEIPDLPGCISQGDSPDEAVDHVRKAMADWISVALEDGRDIPRPRRVERHSGRFVVRLPVSLHAQLARQADTDGVSLNQFVSSALAGAVAWRGAREPVA